MEKPEIIVSLGFFPSETDKILEYLETIKNTMIDMNSSFIFKSAEYLLNEGLVLYYEKKPTNHNSFPIKSIITNET